MSLFNSVYNNLSSLLEKQCVRLSCSIDQNTYLSDELSDKVASFFGSHSLSQMETRCSHLQRKVKQNQQDIDTITTFMKKLSLSNDPQVENNKIWKTIKHSPEIQKIFDKESSRRMKIGFSILGVALLPIMLVGLQHLILSLGTSTLLLILGLVSASIPGVIAAAIISSFIAGGYVLSSGLFCEFLDNLFSSYQLPNFQDLKENEFYERADLHKDLRKIEKRKERLEKEQEVYKKRLRPIRQDFLSKQAFDS